ncbi:MAG: uracil-DNA glycosylase [Desulfobacterales bacterium]
MLKARGASRPVCSVCRHYYVTWDPSRPHGCRVLGFKSRITPILIVRRTTPRLNCQWFSPQAPKGRIS